MSETSDVVTPTLKALNGIPGVICLRLHSGSTRVRGGVMRGNDAGTPDLVASVRGRTVFIEAKFGSGGPSEAQLRFRDMALRAGNLCVFVWSPSEAMAVVRSILEAKHECR